MEKIIETPTKIPPIIQSENSISENSGNDLMKIITPDRLKVPKAFKFPERYTSPTDLMMSPVTKGLLARGRKGGVSLLPPSKNRTMIQDMKSLECGSIS